MKLIKVKGDFKIKDQQTYFKVVRVQLPLILAKNCQNHFLKGFRKGGGQTNKSRGGWEPRKNSDSGRGILIKSGVLRRDIKKIKFRFDRIEVGTTSVTEDYAKIQNEGGTTHPRVTEKMRGFAWKRYKETKDSKWKAIALTKKTKLTVKIPQREFIGDSKRLEVINRNEISEFLKKMLI